MRSRWRTVTWKSPAPMLSCSPTPVDRADAGARTTWSIAATALARNRIVVTADRGGFTDLPGVSVRLVPGSVGKD